MVRLGEHESYPDLCYAVRHLSRGEADVGARRFEHIGAAAETRHLAVAVLGDVSAGRRGGEGGGRGDIEELDAAAPGAAGIDKVGNIDLHLGGEVAHGPGGAGYFFGGFALDAERREQAADLRGRRLAGHHLVKHRARLRLAQAAAVEQACQGFFNAHRVFWGFR